MTSLTVLAATAVAMVAPVLSDLGKSAVEESGKEAAKALLAWMKANLSGRSKEALADLEAHPDAQDNQSDLRKQLAKALEAEPLLAEELRRLVPEQTVQSFQSQAVSGEGTIGVQIAGQGNKFNIQGRYP